MTTQEATAIEARLALQDQRIQAQTVVIGGLVKEVQGMLAKWQAHDDQLGAFDKEVTRIHEWLHELEQAVTGGADDPQP